MNWGSRRCWHCAHTHLECGQPPTAQPPQPMPAPQETECVRVRMEVRVFVVKVLSGLRFRA